MPETLSIESIKSILVPIEELNTQTAFCFNSSTETAKEPLMIVMEVNPGLTNDQSVFSEYVLPAIDKKVKAALQEHFNLTRTRRLYFESGKLSDIEGEADKTSYFIDSPAGLLADLSDSQPDDTSNAAGMVGIVKNLYKKIVELDPVMDRPFLDQGGDSIKVLEFIEKLQVQFPTGEDDIMDVITEETTLNDLIHWLETKRD